MTTFTRDDAINALTDFMLALRTDDPATDDSIDDLMIDCAIMLDHDSIRDTIDDDDLLAHPDPTIPRDALTTLRMINDLIFELRCDLNL